MWQPLFFALLAAAADAAADAAAAAAVSCLYHTVPQALKVSTLWQPTAVAQQVCVDHYVLAMRVGAYSMSAVFAPLL